MASPQPLMTVRRLNADEKRQHSSYHKSLSKRPINDGRRVDLSVFPDNILRPFRTLQWQAFLDLDGPVYDHLVREFYASFEFHESEGNVTFAFGNDHYTIPLGLFAVYLGVPSTGNRFYSSQRSLTNLPAFIDKHQAIYLTCHNPTAVGNNVSTNDLKTPHDLRYKIIDWNILNKHGNHNEIPASGIALLWCLEHGVTVDLGYFIAKRMSGLVTNKTRGLPYAMLLNNLFANLQWNLTRPRNITAHPLDALTMKRMTSKSKRQREDSSDDEVEEIHRGGEEGGPSGSSQPGASGSGDLDDEAFGRLSTREQLTHIHREQRSIKATLTKILDLIACRRSPPRD